MMTATTKQSHEIGQKSVMVHGRESSDLLYPMTPEEFTSQYWERRPVFIKGSAEKLEKLGPVIERRHVFQAEMATPSIATNSVAPIRRA